MAATVQADTLRDVRSVEEDGAVQEMVRSVLVTGLDNTNTNYRTLKEVYDALDTASLTFNSVPTDMTNLVLKRRNAKLIEPTKAQVELVYVAKGDSNLNMTLQGGTSLKQTQRATDRYGFLLTVTHGGVTQGGLIDVSYPITTLIGSRIEITDTPHFTSHLWTARVNSKYWGGAQPGKVLISRVDFEPVDTAATEYLFTYEFVFDLSGWQPDYWYVDPETGRPPSGLVAGTGYKTATWYPSRDFHQLVSI